MSRNVSISKYYKSFSGTDTVVFMLFPGLSPIVIGSLSTISYSMFRNKVPVINIGRTNINGITRGSRIYAGTMVFTLINKHWVRELQEKASYLQNLPTLKVDELPLFDLMIISANEYGSAANMFIYGIDFTDEAQTLSVEDLFTENVFKFVAREVSVFDELVITSKQKDNYFDYISQSLTLRNNFIDEQVIQTPTLENLDLPVLNRNLYLVTNGNMMIGNDVGMVQGLLNLALNANLAITNRFDQPTDQAVREFQRTRSLIINGVVDNNVFTELLAYTKSGVDNKFVQVINKSGAYVYKNPDTNSSITDILPYLSQAEVLNEIDTGVDLFYQVESGYVSKYDTYDYVSRNNSYTYETLQYGDTNKQVILLQQMLKEQYGDFEYTPGTFDDDTLNYLKRFQRENQNLIETGIADYYTWNELLNSNDENYRQYAPNHTVIQTGSDFVPGDYDIKIEDLESCTINITSNQEQNIKFTVITVYENGETKTDSRTVVNNDSNYYDLSTFHNLFIDDVKYGGAKDIYYYVYPYGYSCYKWHFNVKKE